MKFKDKGIEGKFTEATDRFTKKAEAHMQSPEGTRSETLPSKKIVPEDAGQSAQRLQPQSNSAESIQDNISDSESGVQAEFISDSQTQFAFSEPKKEHRFNERDPFDKGYRQQRQSQDVKGTNTLDKEDTYIFFDYDKDSESKAGSATSEHKGHDKMAIKESRTDTAGGATFETHYTKRGTLKSEAKLQTGKKRTDKGGFKDKAVDFADEADMLFRDVAPESNEAAASFADSKVELFLEHGVEKLLVTKDRYGELRREARDERTQLKKEIKKEKKEGKEVDKSGLFNASQAKFVESNDKFEDPVNGRFRKVGVDSGGQAVFLEDIAEEASTQVSSRVDSNSIERSADGGFESDEDEAGSSKNRSVDSYFVDSPSDVEGKEGQNATTSERGMTKEEQQEQAKSKEKAAKQKQKKELRKVAAVTAVAKMFDAKKNMQNQLGDMSGQGTGDLLKDGSGGLLKTLSDGLKQAMAHMGKAIGGAIWKWLASALGSLLLPILIVIVIFIIIVALISSIGGLLGAGGDSGESYDLDVTGDGYVYESLAIENIDAIISELYVTYPDMTYEQEVVLRYSLSKVGCPYDQAFHGNLSVDIFDCSSLAYRAYLQAGIDIAYAEKYTAAAECMGMVTDNKVIDGELQPGDLIFYGGSDNGRYLGIYHVAIYVGKVNGVDKMVEARGVSWGVVYCDVRTNNVVKIARPYSSEQVAALEPIRFECCFLMLKRIVLLCK